MRLNSSTAAPAYVYQSPDISPQQVLTELKKHILVDGFEMVVDIPKCKGSFFYDASTDRNMIDMYGFYASLPVGFNHPRFDRPEVRAELLESALVKVANSDVYTALYARFVQAFARVAAIPEMQRYFFIEGGGLGVENALKAAMDWKVQKNIAAGRGEIGTEILHFKHCFHGRTGYTMSLTNTDPNKIRYFAKFDWPRVSCPSIDFALPPQERDAKAAADEKIAEGEIMAALRDRPHRICAIIIEPIQGEGGDRHFRKEWFQTLRRICDQNEMLLIFDEVQCGMGATGKMWTCQHFDVTPDLIAFGKKVQLGGVMSGPRLDEIPENVFRKSSRINSTWGGNLVDMVRSTHLLHIYEEEKLVENARIMGEKFIDQLNRFAAEEKMITAVRGRGLMLAFSMPDAEIRNKFWKSCWEAGLLVIRCGERSIRMRPVLDVRPEIIDEVMTRMRAALRRI